MKHRLKGLLALVLSLAMVLGLMTCAWGANYTVSTSPLNYNGTVYEPLQEGQLLFADDVIMEGDPTGSGGLFVIKNENNEYVGSNNDSNKVFANYEDYHDDNPLALRAFDEYEVPDGEKYLFKELGNTGYIDGVSYPVSYIHLVPVYTVTYDLQDHGTMTTATQTDIPVGETVDEPADPTEAGWTFGGWYEDVACTNAYDFSSAVHSSFTLYAKWTENTLPAQYTVTFMNGDTEWESTTVALGDTLAIAGMPVPPAPLGYKFAGWYTEDGIHVAHGMTVNSDLVAYATWSKLGGGGIPTPEPEVTPPNTFDSGVALHIGMTILAASGSAWLAKKKD